MNNADWVHLNELLPGEKAIVRRYTQNEEIHCRLREMGLTRGVTVLMKRLAPFGDPMELVVRGFHLSLRKADAETILVEKLALVPSS